MSENTQGPFSHRFDQLAVMEGSGRTPVLLTEDEYNRAKACWDACDGISTEDIEDTTFAEQAEFALGLAKAVDALKAQRDELLDMMRDIVAAPNCEDPSGMYRVVRAAITKAEQPIG